MSARDATGVAARAAAAPTCSCCAAEPAERSQGSGGSGAAKPSGVAAAPTAAAPEAGYALRRELAAFGVAILISLGG